MRFGDLALLIRSLTVAAKGRKCPLLQRRFRDSELAKPKRASRARNSNWRNDPPLRPNLANKKLSYPPTCKTDVRDYAVDDHAKQREQRRIGHTKIAVKKDRACGPYHADDNARENPSTTDDQIEGESSRLPPADYIPSFGDWTIAPTQDRISEQLECGFAGTSAVYPFAH